MPELEQYTRVNDVIVTGLRIKPWSYARAVTDDTSVSRWLPSYNPKGLKWTETALRRATLCPGEMTVTNEP